MNIDDKVGLDDIKKEILSKGIARLHSAFGLLEIEEEIEEGKNFRHGRSPKSIVRFWFYFVIFYLFNIPQEC